MMNLRKIEKFRNTLYHGSIALLYLGGVFFLNKWSGAAIILTIGCLSFSIHSLLSAFAPIKEEYNWELVYPELADADFEQDATKKSNHSNLVNEQ